MPKFNWRRLLEPSSAAMIASGEFSRLLPPEAAATKWAGFAPASDSAIAEAEDRLKLRLPGSYDC
jgi:hypothetical protein